MKKTLLALAGLMLIVPFTAQAAAEKIVVSGVSGEPQMVRAGQTLPVKVGTECQTGDILKTSPGCNVDVSLNNLAGCRVLPSSECMISNGVSSNMKIQIKNGNAILNLKKLPAGSSFQVETPTAVATVRGTQFWGRVMAQDPANPITTFAVRQGVVTVLAKGAGKTFSLKKGQALDIPANSSIAPSVRPALDAELKAMEEASSIKTSA